VSIEGFMSSSILFVPSDVLQDLSLISSGVTASSPYKSLNGVNFVVLDSVVLCDQITLVNSSIHFPFGNSVIFFFMPAKIMPLALSTAPFDLRVIDRSET